MGERIMHRSNVIFTFNTYSDLETYLQWTETSGPRLANNIAMTSKEIHIDRPANTLTLISVYDTEEEYANHRNLNSNNISSIGAKLADLGATRSANRG